MDICPERDRLLCEEADAWLAYKIMEPAIPTFRI
jgi:hypothetical protein